MIKSTFKKISRSIKFLREVWRKGGVYKISINNVNDNNKLSSKVVLITGGSAGIGYAIAQKLIASGATVVITGRNQSTLDIALKKIDSKRLYSMVWDINDISNIDKYLEQIKNMLGAYPNCLINNAGILGGHRKLNELTEERWDSIINTNLKSTVFIIKYITNLWRNKNIQGKIINISSMRGVLGILDGPYGSSKWALNGMTAGLGAFYAPEGIIINGIAPGIIPTRSINIKNIEMDNLYTHHIPAKRYGHPIEIANLACFLISDDSNYIVGQTIVCDGGYSLKC